MENNNGFSSKSPFTCIDAVSGYDFFDREDIIESIADFIASSEKTIYLINGQRRIGKTSLLRKLFETAYKDWNTHPVFFNLQGHAKDEVSNLLMEIAIEINKSIDDKIDLKQFDIKDKNHFHKLFIPEVIKYLENKKLLLLFDEFDTIGAAELIVAEAHKNMAFNIFIPYLEKMVEFFGQKKIPVKIIIACGRNYRDLEENRYGQLLKNALQSELIPFSDKQTREFIKKATQFIPFHKKAVDKIIALSGGHPMFTQCLCDAAFRDAEKNKLSKITESMISGNFNKVIKQNANAVLWIWHTLPDKAKIILFIAAHLFEEKKQIDKSDITFKARQWNLLPATDNMNDTLDLLLRNRFLKHHENTEMYIFNNEFFRKWIIIELNKESLSKLISDIDDESALFIGNARYYYKLNDWDNAVQWYHKILNRFPYHFEAASRLMICYAKENNLDAAYEFYTKAAYQNPLEISEMLTENKITFAQQVLRNLENLHGVTFSKVDIAEISEFKRGKVSEYATDEKGNISGLSLKEFNLREIPRQILQYKNLTSLNLSENKISDISFLKELKSLTKLDLQHNQIRDISPLKELKSLTQLYLSGNQISDISPLKESQNLTELLLANNQISDISPLKELQNLMELLLAYNQISDVSPLKELESLTLLSLGSNQIRDISPLKALTGLMKLWLYNNQISYIHPLKALKSLTVLDLGSNQINDISPLKKIMSLMLLDLQRNQISDISPMKELFNKDNIVIYLEGNTLTIPPIEVVMQGKEAVRNYFEKLNEQRNTDKAKKKDLPE